MKFLCLTIKNLHTKKKISFRPMRPAAASPLLTVIGDARLPVQSAGQRVDADAVVVVVEALRRGQGGVHVALLQLDVPEGRSPARDGP